MKPSKLYEALLALIGERVPRHLDRSRAGHDRQFGGERNHVPRPHADRDARDGYSPSES